jgi:hypothetical protein
VIEMLMRHEHALDRLTLSVQSLQERCRVELHLVGWIGWAPPLEHISPNPQLAARIPGFRPVFASDDFLVQLRAAEAGVGAIVLGRFRSRLAPPTPLVEMKLNLGKLTSSLHLVCAPSSLFIPRVRAVGELLARELMAPRATNAPRR